MSVVRRVTEYYAQTPGGSRAWIDVDRKRVWQMSLTARYIGRWDVCYDRVGLGLTVDRGGIRLGSHIMMHPCFEEEITDGGLGPEGRARTGLRKSHLMSA